MGQVFTFAMSGVVEYGTNENATPEQTSGTVPEKTSLHVEETLLALI